VLLLDEAQQEQAGASINQSINQSTRQMVATLSPYGPQPLYISQSTEKAYETQMLEMEMNNEEMTPDDRIYNISGDANGCVPRLVRQVP